jgi:hypothetical protein
MLPAPVSGDPTKRTAADNQIERNVFVIGPDKKIKLKVATPVNWKNGEDVIIAGSAPARLEVAEALYPHRAAAALTSVRGERGAIELLDGGRGRTALCTQPRTDGLHLRHHAEQVCAGDFSQLVITPAAPGQLRQ